MPNDATFALPSIGFVFQDFELLDYLSVLDNILHPYRITGALGLDKTVRARAAKRWQRTWASRTSLRGSPMNCPKGKSNAPPSAEHYLPQPTLILADEATGNLDPDNKNVILDLLFDSVNDNDATLLAVTHDHELLPRFDRVVDFQNFRQGVPV